LRRRDARPSPALPAPSPGARGGPRVEAVSAARAAFHPAKVSPLLESRCSVVYKCSKMLKTSKFVQRLIGVFDLRLRSAYFFRISRSNLTNAISDDRKASLDAPAKNPMTKSRRCSLCCQWSLARQRLPTRGVSGAMVRRPRSRFELLLRFCRN
jgi:hypothetical protein